MMQITRFIVNMIEENCYLLWDETGEAALIDCGAYYPEEHKAIRGIIDRRNLKLKHLYNTHGHFDHLFGAYSVYEDFGVKIELSADEQPVYEAAIDQMRMFMHREFTLQLPPVERYFHDGDELMVGNSKLKVIATPGHTPGGVCLYAEKEGILFSGDSLFRCEIGRCDLPGGSESQLIHALKTRILALPDHVKVLPGHGDATTIGDERERNPYLQ